MRKVTNAEISNVITGALHDAAPDFCRVDFSDTNIDNGYFYKFNMRSAKFHRSSLRGARMRMAHLNYASFNEADMEGADLSNANLIHANARATNLRGANLYGASMDCAYMYRADLRGAILCGASMRGSRMTGADLTDADIRLSYGNGRQIRTFQFPRYHVVICITHNVRNMAIGCQQHTINKWMQFDDDEIDSMDNHALEWWRVHKCILQTIIDKWDL